MYLRSFNRSLKNLTLANNTRLLFNKKYFFSTLNAPASTAYYNPYHIIGSDKQDEFKSIKKKYLKLVAKYHPDVNQSPDAERMFKLVQESFERIKELRGLSSRRSLIRDQENPEDSFSSVRPNSDQYKQNFEDFKERYKDFDAAEFYYRMRDDKDFSKYAESFKNIYEIKDNQVR